jgi:hypothetical protein
MSERNSCARAEDGGDRPARRRVAHRFQQRAHAIIGYADLIGERLGPDDQNAREYRRDPTRGRRAPRLDATAARFSRKQFLALHGV